MGKVTDRENLFLMLNKEQPEFVPHHPSVINHYPPIALRERPPKRMPGQDWWGVWWTTEDGGPGQTVPDLNKPRVLNSIDEWEDVVKWPDLDAVDWKAAAEKDFPRSNHPDKILCSFLHSGPFERLHSLLGFEETLIATITAPDACDAFFSKLCDYKISIIERLKEFYGTEMIHFHDDWGTQKDLFFRPEFWRTYIKPHIKRVIDATHDMGMLFEMHSCGKIDKVVREVVEIGADFINPAQPVNDLASWAKDFGKECIIHGGFDCQNIIDNPDKTDEDVRQEARDKIDLLAKDAYYIPYGISLTSRIAIACDESFVYGRRFYGNDYEDDIAEFYAGTRGQFHSPFAKVEIGAKK